MKQKLRRSRRSVFRKKRTHPALKAMAWIAVCVVVVAAGFFGAKWITEGPSVDTSIGDTSTPDVPNKGGNSDDKPATPDTPDTPDTPVDTPALSEAIRAFYLPTDALKAEDLPSTLREAAKAGFNAVVFDLKDADGNLYYQFASAQAKKVGYADGALSADDLTALIDTMRECGLSPIPRLYAFRDNAAAKVLTDARVGLESNHSWAWYDGDPNNGGRRWLNPYSEAAHNYVGGLADELKALGAAAIMLDGVEFPAQQSSAYFGEDAATIAKGDILTAFVEKTRARLGDDCPLLLGCTTKSALGTDTKVYGANPLTFGPSVASPALSSDVKASVEKMLLRTQVLEQKPALAPMLMMADATADEANAAIAACVAGGANSFILVTPEDADFSAYQLP